MSEQHGEQEPAVEPLSGEEPSAPAEADGLVEAHARIASLETDLAGSNERHALVLSKYREALLAASPELPPELVSGATVDELEASVEVARQIVTQVRERIGAQATTEPRGFPSGAPGRVEVDTSGLSAGEKIRRGLEARTRGR